MIEIFKLVICTKTITSTIKEFNLLELIGVEKRLGMVRGQIIIYPILNLKKLNCSVNQYVELLENTAEKIITDYTNILVEKNKMGRGIWLKNKKVSSLGVSISKYITYHGISINLNLDINDFSLISPCGLDHTEIGSIHNSKKVVNYELLLSYITGAFEYFFNVNSFNLI